MLPNNFTHGFTWRVSLLSMRCNPCSHSPLDAEQFLEQSFICPMVAAREVLCRSKVLMWKGSERGFSLDVADGEWKNLGSFSHHAIDGSMV